MLIYIPFIWFLGLTLFLWKKQGCIDVSVFLAAEYTLTTFCSILCVKLGYLGAGGILYTNDNIDLHLVPTFLFCTLHTILILPFSRLNTHKIQDIAITNEKLFDLFAYFLIAVAILNIYIVADNIIQVLSEKDFAAVRSAHYAGDETLADAKAKTLPRILGYFYYFNRTSILALPCFFYSICFLNKKWWFNIGLLISALSLPTAGIVSADRTEIIFFTQTICLCLALFFPFIKKPQWQFLKKIFFPLGIVTILYLGGITIARFGNRDQGVSGGALQYAGQGYLNFCYFFDNCHSQHIHTERMLPLYNKITQDDINYPELRDTISKEQGFFISVFPTYLGDFLCDTGIIGMLLWAGVFFILLLSTITKASSKIYFGQIFWYYILATTPMFGIFYYPYFTWLQVVCIIICAIMSILFHYNLKLTR